MYLREEMSMDQQWQGMLWKQFGATMDMLGNALNDCPETLWKAPMWNDSQMPSGFSEFWYVAFHTLFWLDLYLSGMVEGFSPPSPFTLGELDPRGLLPDRVYSREELLQYLDHSRHKCREIIEQLTDDGIRRMCHFQWIKEGISFGELLLYNMRHVQEHAAQLNMLLGQQADISTRWVTRTKSD